MSGLKELKTRIASVQSTKRITSAMKMVAAAKLKKAQDAATNSRPYTRSMESLLARLAENNKDNIPLLVGTGRDDNILIIVLGSDRGLCAGFNANICRDVGKTIKKLQSEGKKVTLLPVGRKTVAALKRQYADLFIDKKEDFVKASPKYEDAEIIAQSILNQFDNGEFDRCILYYNKFISALTQESTPMQLIPFAFDHSDEFQTKRQKKEQEQNTVQYEFEPSEDAILETLIPANIRVQIFHAMLESFASEQGARMTAMDNATRNAGDMIDRLRITYNRSRQAIITKELIEIISGAEAL